MRIRDTFHHLSTHAQDETVLTVGIRDISINETIKTGSTASIVALTQPFSLVSEIIRKEIGRAHV